MDGPADLGAVVVSYNTAPLLGACLSSLRTEIAAAGLATAVHVVDNGSTDHSRELVRRDYPEYRLTRAPENRGYAAAANLALAAWVDGPARAVLVMNADVELRPGALGALWRSVAGGADARAPVGLAGPALTYADGRFQHGAFREPGLVQTWLELFPVARLADSQLNGRYARRLYAAQRPFAVDFVLGACMLASTAALRRAGLLDEGFFMYCEEIDWCRRIRHAGYEVHLVPAAVAVHHAGAATAQNPAVMAEALWRSRLRLARISQPPWKAAVMARLVRAGLRRRRPEVWRALRS